MEAKINLINELELTPKFRQTNDGIKFKSIDLVTVNTLKTKEDVDKLIESLNSIKEGLIARDTNVFNSLVKDFRDWNRLNDTSNSQAVKTSNEFITELKNRYKITMK